MKVFLISIIVIFTCIGFLGYLVILGASKCKTEEEKKIEDLEQIEYLKKNKEESRRKYEK